MGKERMKGIKGESTETSKLTNIKKMVDTSPTSGKALGGVRLLT